MHRLAAKFVRQLKTVQGGSHAQTDDGNGNCGNGRNVGTLAAQEALGRGRHPFIKMTNGGAVRYSEETVLKYLDSRLRTSTIDPGKAGH